MNNQLTTIQKFVDNYVNDLKQKVPVRTGKLKNSIDGDVKKTSDGFEITISMLDYGIFQDKGVNGTLTKYGSPFSFTKLPNLSSSFGSSTDTFPIAKSIMEKGIKPNNFIEKTNNENPLETLATDLIESIWEDFLNNNKDLK